MLSSIISKIEELIELKNAPFADDLSRIEEDFQRMAEFYAQGNIDPELKKVYDKLHDRAEKLLLQVEAYVRTQEKPFYQKMLSDTKGNYTLDLLELHNKLEDFVIDLTMLDLEENEAEKAAKKKSIYELHFEYRKVFFAQVFLAPHLDNDNAKALEEIILSSSIDNVDAQLITTALMLSCMDLFDSNKADILYNVYRRTDNDILRQKALVSYVLGLEQASSSYDVNKNPLSPSLLAQIQQQILYTIDSPRVERIMQQDIMPDIIKNSEFDFQNNRIIAKKKDKLDDILNPHKDEEMIEKMEETMKKMKELQEQGSDLFFGGFRYVKHHPFFSSVVNWFCPFDFNHPQMPVFDNVDDRNIIAKLITRTPFCDSDKYSFVISMKNAIGTIPPEMKQMLKNGEAQLDIVGGGDVVRNAAFIRRTYLQDIYRFLKICNWAKGLYSFINAKHGLVVLPFLREGVNAYDETGMSVAKTLKKFNNELLNDRFFSDWHPYTTEAKIYKAFCIMATENYIDAEELLVEVLNEDEHNVQALFGITKSHFEDFSPELFEPFKDNAIKSLLALYFKNEKDISVQHNLVRAYLLAGENDKALQYSIPIIESGKGDDFEFTFAAIHFFNTGNVKKGFSYLKKTNDDLEEIFECAENYQMPFSIVQKDLIAKILPEK